MGELHLDITVDRLRREFKVRRRRWAAGSLSSCARKCGKAGSSWWGRRRRPLDAIGVVP